MLPLSQQGGTGWRRLIGSPKLQIIFHKRATKHRSLLRKMTYKDKGSYESSPPCSRLVRLQWFCQRSTSAGHVDFQLLMSSDMLKSVTHVEVGRHHCISTPDRNVYVCMTRTLVHVTTHTHQHIHAHVHTHTAYRKRHI